MREIENITNDLFNKIRGRFPNVTLGDDEAKVTTDPAEARFFNFDYIDDNDENYGNVTISLVGDDTIKVIYSRNITDSLDQDKRAKWFSFLKDIRKFSARNMLGFEVRDITKSVLDVKDYKNMSAADTTDDISLSESKMYGSRKSSYQKQSGARIIVRHSSAIDEEKRGSRTRKINSVFIETREKERFKLPFTNLHGARAMARHINNGGSVNDDIGKDIAEMVEESSQLAGFVRKLRNKEFADASACGIIESARTRLTKTRKKIKSLASSRGYSKYSKSFNPQSRAKINPDDLERTINEIRSKLVKSLVDETIADSLPAVAKTLTNLEERNMDYVHEAKSQFESESFALVLESDTSADQLIMSGRFEDNTALLKHIMDDINKRAVDAVMKKFASTVLENFETLSDTEMLLASRISKQYISNLASVTSGTGDAYRTASAVVESVEPNYTEEFESWAEGVAEGAADISEDEVAELVSLFSQPIEVGVDGSNAIASISDIINAEALSEQLSDLAATDPNADARQTMFDWIKETQPEIAQQMRAAKDTVEEGYTIMPPMDRERYQERDGLEGPFQMKSGKVVYYDPREGKYYDSDTDMYMSDEEYFAHDKASQHQAPAELEEEEVEAHVYGPTDDSDNIFGDVLVNGKKVSTFELDYDSNQAMAFNKVFDGFSEMLQFAEKRYGGESEVEMDESNDFAFNRGRAIATGEQRFTSRGVSYDMPQREMIEGVSNPAITGEQIVYMAIVRGKLDAADYNSQQAQDVAERIADEYTGTENLSKSEVADIVRRFVEEFEQGARRGSTEVADLRRLAGM